MTAHAAADIIWCLGALLATLALDFLCRRFGGGRIRRHPGRPSAGCQHILPPDRTRIYQAIHQEEDVDV